MKRLAILAISFTFALLLTPLSVSQDKVVRKVTNEQLEKILQTLEVKYQKEDRKDKDVTTTFYEFKRGDNSFRLYNYVNDLWIEMTFEKTMKLEDINRWNADAKFSRLVLVPQRDKTMVSLESQIDCVGGVTDAMIKQFINRFDDEAKRFAKFTKP